MTDKINQIDTLCKYVLLERRSTGVQSIDGYETGKCNLAEVILDIINREE